MITPQEILYLALAFASVAVAIFLCWALYETATLVRRANKIVDETTEKIARVENAVMMIKDKLEHSVTYLGILVEGGKALLSHFTKKDENGASRRKKKSDLYEE